jgi:hypothetical protein
MEAPASPNPRTGWAWYAHPAFFTPKGVLAMTEEVVANDKALVAQQPPSVLAMLAIAVERGTSPDELAKLVDLHERIQAQQALTAYNVAMNHAQAEMPAIIRDARNERTGNPYALFETLNAQIKPIYSRHGFSLSFTEEPQGNEKMIRLVCKVRHIAGHVERHQGDYPRDGEGPKGGAVMNAIQGTGSTHSYAKRYMLKDIFNLAEANEDNDGAGALDTLIAAEVEWCQEALKAGKVDYERFCAWISERQGGPAITELDQILRRHFPVVRDMLQRKIHEKKGAT